METVLTLTLTMTMPQLMAAQAEGHIFLVATSQIRVGPVATSDNGERYCCQMVSDGYIVGELTGDADTTLRVVEAR
jgi:hypothetical protein